MAGVVAEDDEQRYDIRAKAVILATGGFGSNPELMEEYLPLFADGVIATNAGATGDGILMTRQFGTKIVGDGSMGSIVAPDGSSLITANFLVNLNGERFVGEGRAQVCAAARCVSAAGEGRLPHRRRRATPIRTPSPRRSKRAM